MGSMSTLKGYKLIKKYDEEIEAEKKYRELKEKGKIPLIYGYHGKYYVYLESMN